MDKLGKIVFAIVLSVFPAIGTYSLAAGADLKGDIKFLMDYTVKHAGPQQGPGGSAMWVLGKKEIPGGGSRNIFFRVHDGGNRPYITVMCVTITAMPNGNSLVRSAVITDGGCVLRNNDDFGPVDGRPDSVCENIFILSPIGEILEKRWGSECCLRANNAEYNEISSLFAKCIKEIINNVS